MANKTLSSEDLADLRYAKSLLENPSLAARIANVVGKPIEIAIERLPDGTREIIRAATTKSLEMALDVAHSLPIVGAAGGALINVFFIDHFQDVGRGHFIVRRLERVYDPDLVRSEYLKLPMR